MTALEGFPLPKTAKHDENGNHVPPYIPEWVRGAGTDRAVLGSEVERDQRQKAAFAEHIQEHRRRSEPVIVVERLRFEEDEVR